MTLEKRMVFHLSFNYFCFMTKNKAWINAMRLRTLPLSLSGIIIGSAIAYSDGYWNSLIFVLAISTTILFQVLSNLANDLGDSQKGTDNNNRVGPERAVQSGIISLKEMKMGVIVTAILSFISAGILIYVASKSMSLSSVYFYIGLTIISILAAITYTVGKKAYGYHGMGDLMVLFFFGGVSVLGVYSLYAPEFSIDNILIALFVGLLSVAVLNLNNMRDYKNDEACGKNTLVVKMGPNYAKFYHTILILSALTSLFIFILRDNNFSLFIGMIPGIYLLFHIRKVMSTTKPEDFDPELKKVALTTFAISVLTSILLFTA